MLSSFGSAMIHSYIAWSKLSHNYMYIDEFSYVRMFIILPFLYEMWPCNMTAPLFSLSLWMSLLSGVIDEGKVGHHLMTTDRGGRLLEDEAEERMLKRGWGRNPNRGNPSL